MRYRLLNACAIAAWICPALLMAASPQQLRLKWSDVGPATTGSRVGMVLPTGTHIEGKVLGSDADGLRLRVSKTSNKKEIAKGERTIPRRSVSVLHVTKYGTTFRILCTAGLAAAAGAIVASQQIDLYEGPGVYVVPATATAGTIGLGVGGYFIGKRLDRRVTEIAVIPEEADQ